MKIAIPKEKIDNETRVAITPDVVKKYKTLGFDVVVEKGAGLASGYVDAEYREAGSEISTKPETLFKDAEIVLKIRAPEEGEIKHIKKGTILLCQLNALTDSDAVKNLRDAEITSFALELMPRISRAQSMDILSSQSNLAGYRAVIDAASEYKRAFPMMMTAAGTIAPARVFVLGAGVAGLQAIATAKRLGAIVYAYDVRPAVKEQVESLGGKFVLVDEEAMKNAETKGGYAKEMGEEYKKKQAEAISNQIKKTDIAICTALIPGRAAPVLITEDMLKDMREGSVVVDLAAEAGGNCEGSKAGKIVEKHGVKIIGFTNFAGRVAADASQLFARNLYNFIAPMCEGKTGNLKLNFEDELVVGTCVTHEGKIINPRLNEKGDK